jgi:hypothetical protein
VDKDSAVLNLPNEVAVGVAQANHRTICKFERVDSQKYIPVWRAARALCQDALREESLPSKGEQQAPVNQKADEGTGNTS